MKCNKNWSIEKNMIHKRIIDSNLRNISPNLSNFQENIQEEKNIFKAHYKTV